MLSVTSCGGILSLLSDNNDDIKLYALQKLDEVCGVFWAEISDHLITIEEIYEKDFKNHLAALVCSKVYFHLQEYDLALTFALKAQNLFDLSVKTEYVETIICTPI